MGESWSSRKTCLCTANLKRQKETPMQVAEWARFAKCGIASARAIVRCLLEGVRMATWLFRKLETYH
jgi:hypothetical protein